MRVRAVKQGVRPEDGLRGIRFDAVCDAGGRGIRALVCRGSGWMLREEVVSGEFDLAFSRLLADLRRRLKLSAQQMALLEGSRHLLSVACPASSAA